MLLDPSGVCLFLVEQRETPFLTVEFSAFKFSCGFVAS